MDVPKLAAPYSLKNFKVWYSSRCGMHEITESQYTEKISDVWLSSRHGCIKINGLVFSEKFPRCDSRSVQVSKSWILRLGKFRGVIYFAAQICQNYRPCIFIKSLRYDFRRVQVSKSWFRKLGKFRFVIFFVTSGYHNHGLVYSENFLRLIIFVASACQSRGSTHLDYLRVKILFAAREYRNRPRILKKFRRVIFFLPSIC